MGLPAKNDANPSLVKRSILERFRQMVREYNDADHLIAQSRAEIERLEKRKAVITNEVSDCYAAARLFNFDLVQEYNRLRTEEIATSGYDVPDASGAAPPPPVAQAIRPTVRQMVLEAAEQAYPRSVRAAALRKQFEERGIKLHEKTIGMTLYRLLRAGSVRRAGKADWFFVPPDQRAAQAEYSLQRDEQATAGERAVAVEGDY